MNPTMRPRTRPTEVLGIEDHSCTNRIQFHISHGRSLVRLVEHAGEGPTLPQVSTETVLLIKGHGIGGMTTMKGLPDRIFSFGNGHEMDMIRHQAVSQDVQQKPTRVFEKQIKVHLAISFVEKHVRLMYSLLRDVMCDIRHYDARNSSHRFGCCHDRKTRG